MSKIIDTVTDLAKPILAPLGLELWDAEFVKEAGYYYLRVYIDSAKGVSIEDCETVSRALDPKLDEYDALFPEAGYTFEVSSAGAERKLTRPGDFERFLDSLVELKTYKPKNGKREHIGTLKAYNDGDVTLDIKGETFEFTKAEVANVRLRIQI
ncbi:MAG: ribosome maturation factor RimP [Oscillospiraceae bacterium]|jgi:ribosome maturation factor RimP|nr:ribosome maturation factor RimP [Oscillospiraceae bacterium]